MEATPDGGRDAADSLRLVWRILVVLELILDSGFIFLETVFEKMCDWGRDRMKFSMVALGVAPGALYFPSLLLAFPRVLLFSPALDFFFFSFFR